MLAALKHPNIGAIYGLEETSDVGAGFSRPVRALVLELVDGDTLADRIARGPIPVDEALPIAKQIAEARSPRLYPLMARISLSGRLAEAEVRPLTSTCCC